MASARRPSIDDVEVHRDSQDDVPKFFSPVPKLSARPMVPGAAAFRMTEARLKGGYMPFRYTEDRSVHRFQEHIGADRKRHTAPGLDPCKYDLLSKLSPRAAAFPSEGAYVAYERTQRPRRDDRAHSNPFLHSPRPFQTTLYKSQFTPPPRSAQKQRDRFGARESGGQFYCLHPPSNRVPTPGAYPIRSSFEAPPPRLSRAMAIAVSRTIGGDGGVMYMPVKPIAVPPKADKAERAQSARAAPSTPRVGAANQVLLRAGSATQRGELF